MYKDLRNTPEPHRATPCPSPRALPMGQHPAAARSWRQVRRAEGWLQKVAHAKPRAAQGGPMLGARPPVLHFALLGCAQKHPGRQPDTHRGPPRPASKTGPLQKPLQELRCKQLLSDAKARFSLLVPVLPGLSVGGRSVRGSGSDDVVLIATPTAGGRVLATIRRQSLPKRCL